MRSRRASPEATSTPVSDFHKPLRDESYALHNAVQLRAVTRACFADEIAIDFPALGTAIDRVRETFATPDESLAAAYPNVDSLVREGLLTWNEERLVLSEAGLLVADSIFASFF